MVIYGDIVVNFIKKISTKIDYLSKNKSQKIVFSAKTEFGHSQWGGGLHVFN